MGGKKMKSEKGKRDSIFQQVICIRSDLTKLAKPLMNKANKFGRTTGDLTFVPEDETKTGKS